MGDSFLESRELIKRLGGPGAPRAAAAGFAALVAGSRFAAGGAGRSVDRGLALCDALYARPRRQPAAPGPAGAAG